MTPLSADLAATLRRALAAHRSGQWTRAAAGYEQILLAQPDYPEVLQLLGTVRFQTGDAASAVTLLERVIALQPLNAAPHVSLALVFQSVRRFQDALGHLTRALELNPAVPDVLVMRGNVLRELDRHAAALADYEAALRLRPDNPEALNNRGNLLRHFHRHDEALESYARAIALRPGFAEAHVNRGNGLRELNRLDAAREAYQRALEIVPDSVRVHRSLASVTPLTRDGALYRALQSFAPPRNGTLATGSHRAAFRARATR
ncbi:MAG: tetratricopeptide repeat protein [Pararobbsia sp.]